MVGVVSLFAVLVGLLLVAGLVAEHRRRRALERTLEDLRGDLALTEDAARIGYFSRAVGADRIKWSRGMFAVFGHDPQTYIPSSRAVLQQVLPDYLPAVERLRCPTESGGRGGETEIRIRRPDGGIRDVLIVLRYRADKRGKISDIFGVAVDITAVKAAERGIVEREAELQQIILSTGGATWSLDVATGVLHAAPRFAEILGLGAAALTRELHDSLCHPADLQYLADSLQAHVARGTPYDLAYRIRHASGSYVWLHSFGRLIGGGASGPARVVGMVLDVTGHRNAAADLARGRESLQLAMDASQAGHFDIDETAGTAHWSPRALEILGCDAASPPTAADLAHMVHPDDLAEFLAEREEFRIHGRPLDIECRVRHRAGRRHIWVHLRAIRPESAAGGAVRTIGIIRDVSLRRGAQQAVADSEKKFRDLIEGSIQAILILDRETPLFCNRACARLFGYDTPDQFLAEGNMLAHLPPDAAAAFEEAWVAPMQGAPGGAAHHRRLVHRTGRTIDVEVVGRSVQWDGRAAWQLTMVDVTERDRMEQALRESEEQFRLLASNASDVIVVYDESGTVGYVSPSAVRVSGYAPSELVGRTGMDMIHPDDREAILRHRKEIIGGARRPDDPHRWRLICRDGRIRWIETTSALLPARPGKALQIVSASRDITERVEREVELGAAHDRLEVQAGDLARLARNLEAERQRAETANTAKSDFLAMMSHELRTPMTGVLGMADLLLMTDMNEEQRDLTRLLTRSARTLLDILNDILDFSKIEAGQLQIESTPYRVSDVVADVRDLFISTAAEKGIVLEAHMPAAYRDRVIGDPKRLRQVLSNLVNNALKFTHEGGVGIAFEQHAAGDDLILVFTVTDTGIGIAGGEMVRLFAPFIQADVSTSRKFGGTGLGLAICKRLVEAMGGMIDVESKPGEGSRFTFSIKARPDHESEPAPRAADAAADAPHIVPRRILLAEDNKTSRYLIAAMLQRNGHRVDAVDDGLKAVEAVRDREPYDVVLMDMQMPVMDGHEAARAIRRLPPPRGEIPIIALTAAIIAEHRAAFIRAGLNAVVGKPVNWQELEREIERRCAEGPAPPASDSTPGFAPDAAPSPPPGTALVDDAALAMLADSLGHRSLAGIIGSFVENMDQYRADLRAAHAAGDLGRCKRTAHALKGLGAQFGALRVSALARAIEDDAPDLEAVGRVLLEIDEAVAATAPLFAARRAALAAV